MVKPVDVWSLLTLSLFVLTVPSYADDHGNFFDGAGGSIIAVPAADLQTLRSISANAAPVPEDHVRQSGADLFYFTREEALMARKRFGARREGGQTNGYEFDRNVPADIQKRMRDDLAFMQGISGWQATPLHQQIFGMVNGPAYFKFFSDRVTGIGMNNCGSANAVACVIPYLNPSKMWLTKNFIKFNHPQISRMMVVYHEARHTETENGNWPHLTCPTPFLDANGKDIQSIWTGAILAGEPACEETPFGAYGSSTIMLKNISKYCTNCTNKVKMDADLYADDQLGRIIEPDAKKQMLDDFGE
ncbi:MAG TPA: hypothetical protein DCZ01_13075 [Elusimicrobia bacterium]|nr:MAG: hypothetical protein A2X37_04475 [Elusimicrobia bacterium GWA2_66_18]OGR69901.1 MAG: hypothetical protein A2X40_10335 [Elusimicrobia bacterium GWC2_65_9]HAZ09415.1 hypothetical protein [Elusimicrobiota bacterium]